MWVNRETGEPLTIFDGTLFDWSIDGLGEQDTATDEIENDPWTAATWVVE